MSNLLEKASILLTPTAYDDGKMLSVKPEDGTGDFTFSRNGDATRVNSSGIIVTEGANLPRINYENGCGSWLLEPQSTNSVFQSNLLNAISGGIVTPNAAISPDGTTNAIKVNFGTGVNSGGTISVGGSSAIASTEYTISFYAKNFSGDGTFGLRVDTDTQATLVNENFTATSDWVRYTHTFTTDAAASSFGTGSRFRKLTNNNEVLFFGMQIEQLSFATSYIPTNGATSTRLQDIATNSGNSTLINSTEGTLYAELAALVNGESNRVISLLGVGSNLKITFRTLSNRIRIGGSNNGVTLSNVDYNSFVQTNNNKIAVSYSASGVKLFVNGVLVGSNTDNASFPTDVFTNVNFANLGPSNIFYGKVKAAAVYKEALTDAELQCLTTI